MEEGMATSSSIHAWRIPWIEEPDGLQSTGSHRVGHDWSDLARTRVLQKYAIFYGETINVIIKGETYDFASGKKEDAALKNDKRNEHPELSFGNWAYTCADKQSPDLW